MPRKVHVNTTAPNEEKKEFKKNRTDTCGCSKPRPTATATTARRRGRQRLYLGIMDESFLF
jgi:hypothetical protein